MNAISQSQSWRRHEQNSFLPFLAMVPSLLENEEESWQKLTKSHNLRAKFFLNLRRHTHIHFVWQSRKTTTQNALFNFYVPLLEGIPRNQ